MIRILEADPVANRCREGLCFSINRAVVTTLQKKLIFSDKCMEDSEDKTTLRWFEETANPWNLGWPNHTNFWQARQRGEMLSKGIKMFEVEMLAIETQKRYDENFGSDLAMDQQVIREQCEKGPCMKFVRGLNLPKLYKKLLEEKSRFGSSALKGAI